MKTFLPTILLALLTASTAAAQSGLTVAPTDSTGERYVTIGGVIVDYVRHHKVLEQCEERLTRFQVETLAADELIESLRAEIGLASQMSRDQEELLALERRQRASAETEAAINRKRFKRSRLWKPVAIGLSVVAGALLLQ